MWAEDGNIFIAGALDDGGLTSLFRPYAGYLHFLPRVAAALVVRLFEPEVYALAMTISACMTLAGVALVTYYCSSALTDLVWVRAAWAVIPVLTNVGAIETLGNFANLHWYLLWLTPWLLLRQAKSRTSGILLFAAAAAVSLTEIISVVFLPLMLVNFKTRGYWYARAGLTIGLACQVYTTLTYPRPSGSEYSLHPLSAIIGWALNTAGPIFYGDAGSVVQLVLAFGPAPLLLAALAVTGLIVSAVAIGNRRERIIIALFTYASIVVYLACVFANKSIFFDYAVFNTKEWTELFSFTRYSVVPTMFIMAIIPTIGISLSRRKLGSQKVVLAGFAFLFVAMYFVPGTNRDGGPVWAEQVGTARLECSSGDQVAAVIKVAPHFYDGDVHLSCSLLQKSRP